MSQEEYASMLTEIRFIEHDLEAISDHLEKLTDSLDDMKKRALIREPPREG